MPRLPSLGLALSALLSTACENTPARYGAAATVTTTTANPAEGAEAKEELLSSPSAYLAGTPIYTTPSLTERTAEITHAYQQVRQHWEGLEAQFSRVSSLSLHPTHPYRAGEANMSNGEIHFYGVEADGAEARPAECLEGRDATFIHELAHVWHGFLLREDRREFEQQWREVSRDQYDPYSCDESRLHNPVHNADCRTMAKQAAAVTAYGGKSLEEDVAELVTLAYQVLKCPEGQRLPNKHTIIPENRDRIIQKLGLLEEYGFMTETAMNAAITKIR